MTLFYAGSGSVDFDEFVAAFAETFKPPSQEELLQAFRSMDKSGDGFLSIDELKEGMINTNQPASDEAIQDLLKYMDKDKDGKISYEGIYLVFTLMVFKELLDTFLHLKTLYYILKTVF